MRACRRPADRERTEQVHGRPHFRAFRCARSRCCPRPPERSCCDRVDARLGDGHARSRAQARRSPAASSTSSTSAWRRRSAARSATGASGSSAARWRAAPSAAAPCSETEERRRETKAGFATQKECQAAMNKLLVAVEAHNYTAPTKATVRQYLTKEWLPAVKATIRPSTYNSYVQHVECHIAPHIGSREARQAHGQPGQRPLREARRVGLQGWQARSLRR